MRLFELFLFTAFAVLQCDAFKSVQSLAVTPLRRVGSFHHGIYNDDSKALLSTSGASIPPKTATTSLSNINRLVSRTSWVSWWFQIVLSVISGVILTFANTVRKGDTVSQLWSSGFAFSGIGVCISFINAFWTWNFTRLSKRIASGKVEESKVIPTLTRYAKISVAISLVGMLVTILGAEQIVGSLASKVLAQGNAGSFMPLITTTGLGQTLQALDIFLVQANTNAIVSHYVPLLCYIYLQTQL